MENQFQMTLRVATDHLFMLHWSVPCIIMWVKKDLTNSDDSFVNGLLIRSWGLLMSVFYEASRE